MGQGSGVKYPLYLALRYLRARKMSYLAVAAIALSIGTILTVLYVLWGLSLEFQKQARGVLPDLTAEFTSSYGLTDYAPVLRKLRDLDDVEACAPILKQWVLLERGGRYVPAQVCGVDLDSESKVLDMRRWFGKGAPAFAPSKEGSASCACLGRDLAQNAALSEGDLFPVVAAVYSSPSSVAPSYFTLGRRTFELGSTFQSWDAFTDQYAALVDLADAQKLLRRYEPAAVSGIKIRLREGAPADAARGRIEGILREADPSVWVRTWRQMNPGGLAMVDAENRLMAVILSLILVASSFSIAVILGALVREKRREIGILKSMGATTAGIARLFLVCGGAIGFLGATAGVGLSLVAQRNIDWIDGKLQQLFGYHFAEAYRLERMPTEIDAQAVLLLWLVAFGVSVLASLYPAIRAARLDPVETLRYE